MLLAAGITTWVVGQAAINLGAVVGLLPVSGITLPFLSAGGSSLVFSMAGAGILANVARQSLPASRDSFDAPTGAHAGTSVPGRPVSEPTFAILAGGGTGGHVYPALSLAQELVARGHDPSSVHFVGGKRGPEGRVVPDAGYSIDLLPGRGLQRRLTFANVGVVFETLVAFVRAFGIVRRRRPRVVVGFGGYASLPCVVAAWIWRIPRVVHEQDSVIGLANRIGVRLGARVAASLPGVEGPDVVFTGNPVRAEFKDFVRHVQAPPLVAAFGGALGAGSINRATVGLYDRWRDREDLAVHHVTGPRNVEACAAELASLRKDGDVLDYELVGYEADMPGCSRVRPSRCAGPAPAPLPSSRPPASPRCSCRCPARRAITRRATRARWPARAPQWSSPTETATRCGSTRSSRSCSPRRNASPP